ncbi:porin [Aeromonas cavernicola]|uniref:Porin n=1 Tax=Aeromonas cavernicola TaxID=1006623 RepID=A0A2H9U2E4_9GAMM|nr:porin [Aeromonas cavernicola]PJG58139.1 porin [Aeromonas cavernicola]
MNKTAISLLISMAALSLGADAAVVYTDNDGSDLAVIGRLGADFNNRTTDDIKGSFDARIGVKGRQKIDNQFSLIGLAQYQVNAAEYANSLRRDSNGNLVERGDNLVARYVWVGIDGNELGKVTFGRVSSGLISMTDVADIFAAASFITGRQASRVDPTAVQIVRQDATIQYSNIFNNIEFSTAYILGNGSSDLDYGYNTLLSYTFDFAEMGRLVPVVAYQQTMADHQEGSIINNDAQKYRFGGAGARYYVGDFIIGALYSSDSVSYADEESSRDDVLESNVTYNINSYFTTRVGYRHLENDGGGDMALRDYLFELQYKLTPFSSIYTTYVIRNGRDGSAGQNTFGHSNDDDIYHLGLRYDF